MKILLTGATGFLGKILSETLQAQGHQVTEISSKNADLTKPDALKPWNKTPLDQIFHLAAWTQAGNFCLTHSGEQWIKNQQINTQVLTWWHSFQPQAKMIAIGTSCSYDPKLPMEEKNYLVGEPISDLFVYAMTKRMLYSGLVALAKQFQQTYLHVIPSTLYGSGYHTDGRQMHFIFDLIRKILRAKKLGEPVVLWGDGYQKRELVFVHDFVRIMLKLNQSYDNEIFNIGDGREYTIREFAQMICEIVGYDYKKIQFDTSQYVGAKSKCLVVDKLHACLESRDTTSLADGLKTTIQWFEKAFY